MKQLADLRAELDDIDAVASELGDARETVEILGDEAGADAEIDALIASASTRIEGLEMAANFDRPYDDHGAIVAIHAGAGGVILDPAPAPTRARGA
ncbi:MAG: hypothetical protein NVSMB59_22840 [Vulcanimicrobiaceae bacterium]